MGKLYAISDLHVSYKFNLEAFTEFFTSLPSKKATKSTAGENLVSETQDVIALNESMLEEDEKHGGAVGGDYFRDFTEDGLILAGDISEKLEHLRACFKLATEKFKVVWWVPGNHELYTLPGGSSRKDVEDGDLEDEELSQEERDSKLNYKLRGEAKYVECVRMAREYGVLTPEDEFVRWQYEVEQQSTEAGREGDLAGPGREINRITTTTAPEAVLVCPIFTLYDYSFRPAHISREQALDWAMEQDVKATDEMLLHPDPYPTRDEWCESLLRKTEQKLSNAQSHGLPLVIINHWPLREDLITIPSVPRFTLWCGSKKTEDWHNRFNAKVVVTGHLHVRRTDWRDKARFEEVSLGYPRQWEGMRMIGRGVGDAIREILPGDYGERDEGVVGGTIWRRNG